MSRQATIIGRKGEKWSSIATGPSSQIRAKFKHDNFAGYSQVYYLDTSGGHKRKKGSPADTKKATPKK